MPSLSLNILSKICYSSFAAEVLRIARTTTTFDIFKVLSKLLINGLIRQGGNPKEIKKTLIKRLIDIFKLSVSSVILECLYHIL